ncbi:MAG: flagellar biosynthetic protein FliO [Ramlibacter sp.]|nr:flagellar biosynthetic protein FliO [Ramlibacter sp.]
MTSMAWSFLMLLLVLALIPATLWTLKRVQNFRPPGAPREMEVTSQVALGARERVVMVRVRGREFILGVTPQQVTLLAEAPSRGDLR